MLGVFVVANLLGVMAHVPGGIGVFESVVTLLLAPLLPLPDTGGADPLPHLLLCGALLRCLGTVRWYGVHSA